MEKFSTWVRLRTSDDFALMREVRGGSADAFSIIMERHQGALYRFFRFLGSDPHSAEDRVQETFIRLFQYRDRYQSRVPFHLFLYTLARNVWRDCTRKIRRSPAVVPGEFQDAEIGSEPGFTIPDFSRLMSDRVDLKEALFKLPDRLKIVLVLSVYQGLSYPEIAAAMGMPLGTVKSRMFYALRSLRECLKSHVPG